MNVNLNQYKISKIYISKQDYSIMKIMNIKEEDFSKEIKLPILVSETWKTGGMSGGNCWGNKAENCIEAEDEVEFTELHTFLQNEYPELTFLKFLQLKKFVMTSEYTEAEYYGNYRNFRFKYILYSDIYKILESC